MVREGLPGVYLNRGFTGCLSEQRIYRVFILTEPVIIIWWDPNTWLCLWCRLCIRSDQITDHNYCGDREISGCVWYQITDHTVVTEKSAVVYDVRGCTVVLAKLLAVYLSYQRMVTEKLSSVDHTGRCIVVTENHGCMSYNNVVTDRLSVVCHIIMWRQKDYRLYVI